MENELPKRKSLIWVFLILGIVLVSAIVCYLTIFNSSKNYYKRVIGSTIDSVLSDVLKMYDNNEKINTSLKIDSNIELDTNILDQKILDIINELVLGINVQTDINNKKVALNLDTKYQNADLLNASIIQNDSNTYMYSKDILGDKYIKIDESDFNESFDVPNVTTGKKINYNTAKKEIIKEAKKIIKDKYCSKKMQGMNNIYTFTISEIDFGTELQNLFKNLSENNTFVNCFEEEANIRETLLECCESLEEVKEEASSEIMLAFDIEASSLTQKVEKVAIYELENDVVTSKINVDINGDKYTYQLKNNDTEILNGEVIVQKNKEKDNYTVITAVPEVGKITVNLEIATNNNVNIVDVSQDKAVDVENLTESDIEQIMKNIENSKIKEFIEDFTNILPLAGMNLTEDSSSDSFSDFEFNTSDENKESLDSGNSVVTYDGNITVEYKAPNGYELSDFSSKNYKNYSKDGIDIKISSYSSSVEEYLSKLDERATYYTSENSWSNVKLSHKKEIKVGNRACYYRELSAVYGSGEYANNNSTVYACTKLDNDNVYIVEIDAIGEEMPIDVLNTLFDINVK